MNYQDLPREIVEEIIQQSDPSTLNKLKFINRYHQRLVHLQLAQYFQNSYIRLKIRQEENWFLSLDFEFKSYNKLTQELIFHPKELKPFRFFYALLVSKPYAYEIDFILNDTEYELPLKRCLILRTKKRGIHVASPLDTHCSLLYTVEKNSDLNVVDEEHDAPGVRWITPLSFICYLELFDNVILKDSKDPRLNSLPMIAFFKRVWWGISDSWLKDRKVEYNISLISPTYSNKDNNKKLRGRRSHGVYSARRPPILSI